MTVSDATRTDKTDDDGEYLAFALVFQIATIIVEPFVIAALWRWFLVPLGLPPLHWLSAFGLNLVFGLLAFRWHGKRSNKDQFDACLSTFFAGLLALGVGYIALKLGS